MPAWHDEDCECHECRAEEELRWLERNEHDDDDQSPPDDLEFDVSDIDDAEVTTPRPRVTLSGLDLAAGVLTIEVGGERQITVPVDEGDGNLTVAVRAAAAINGEPGPW